jgi:membrane protein involved in colicin uptake
VWSRRSSMSSAVARSLARARESESIETLAAEMGPDWAAEARREHGAAVVVQSSFRGLAARREIDQQKVAATKIQASYRGRSDRNSIRERAQKRATETVLLERSYARDKASAAGGADVQLGGGGGGGNTAGEGETDFSQHLARMRSTAKDRHRRASVVFTEVCVVAACVCVSVRAAEAPLIAPPSMMMRAL